jgi:colicin import membrane protein
VTGFRKSLIISAALHVSLLLGTMVAFRSPTPHQTAALDSIPLELVDDISDDQQRAGEQRAERTETPQQRQAPTPQPRPEPTPVPPEAARPVDPSSAPEPPPPAAAAEPPPPEPARPIPTPPTRPATPPPPQQTAQAEEPPDEEGLLRRIEEDRRREQEQRQAQQQREQREREAREARERQQREARERQQREARERRERRERERQQQQAQQQQFDAQAVRNLINTQRGAPQPQAQQGETRTASLGNPRGSGQRLTQSQIALLAGMIRDQIAPCWSPPPGVQGANRAVVRIELLMNQDGSFNARPRVLNASNEPGFRPLADSAVRAIENCARRQGGKLNLPPEQYNVPNGWREIEFAFDPSQML